MKIKITELKLKRIIKEELIAVLQEGAGGIDRETLRQRQRIANRARYGGYGSAPRRSPGPNILTNPSAAAKGAFQTFTKAVGRFAGPIATGVAIADIFASLSPGKQDDIGKAYATGGEEAAYNVWAADQIEQGNTPPSYKDFKAKEAQMRK